MNAAAVTNSGLRVDQEDGALPAALGTIRAWKSVLSTPNGFTFAGVPKTRSTSCSHSHWTGPLLNPSASGGSVTNTSTSRYVRTTASRLRLDHTLVAIDRRRGGQ